MEIHFNPVSVLRAISLMFTIIYEKCIGINLAERVSKFQICISSLIKYLNIVSIDWMSITIECITGGYGIALHAY